MNLALMRHAGMGSPWDGIDPGYPSVTGGVPTLSDWPDEGDSSSAPPWWALLGPSIISTAGTLTRDIFAPTQTSQAAYGAQALQRLSTQSTRTYDAPPAGYTYDQQGRLVPLGTTGSGIGASLERFVRENSTLLLIGAGLLVLIQMPGFTRRGR